MDIYEEKRLNTKMSESRAYHEANPDLSIDVYLEKLRNYDIISFDIFDTLIFRPLAQPVDVFYLLGERLGIMDFKNIRIWAEQDARIKCYEKNGHTEVTLTEIWDNLKEDVGNMADNGAVMEEMTEQKLCYANPFMLALWQKLKEMNKKLIIISDMYLPGTCIASILENAGFTGAQKIYISGEYHKSKADGKLFRQVIHDFYGENFDITSGKHHAMIHIGDNPHSDVAMAKKSGIHVLPYPNVNHNLMLYRATDMSYLIGSAYRALICNHLYNGLRSYSMEYEYGYIYGGLFVLGYCGFIHDYCQKHAIDKILFLSRDGDILKQVYDLLYPENCTEYVYWSRKVATKLMAGEDKHDYFRRFIYHKVNQNLTIRDILHSMELDFLLEELDDWHEIWKDWCRRQNEDRRHQFIDLRPEDELTDKNGYLLRRFIEAKWDKVMEVYSPQQTAAEKYYRKILSDCSSAVAVDIGWAGSGALALAHLTEDVWKIPCQITGIIAGTNTIHNAEPDASEPFLQNGKLVAYLYSQQHNRDLLKKHDPGKNYNVYWELLLSSPTPQFVGFYEGNLTEAKDKSCSSTSYTIVDYIPELQISLGFGKYDDNQDGIREIQRGIMDFVKHYREHFSDYPYMFHISGRDAYAPMLVACSHKERYLKAIEKKFSLNIGVN
ncbi:MAG: HAD family hydrolase [Lachnospiraceae bacterium]